MSGPYEQGGPAGDVPSPDPAYGYGPPSYGGGAPDDAATPPAQGDQAPYDPPPATSDPYQPPQYDAGSTGYDPQGGAYPAPPAGPGGYGAPAGPYGVPPAGAGPYGAPPAGAGPYGTPPPPRKKRTGLVIGLIAGGLVVVVGLAVGLFALLSGGGDKPSAVVRTYLQALSEGNAQKALDQGEKPPDTTFVTGDTLKAQQAIAKISAIDVSDGYSSGKRARVSATYKFGDKQADESFSLTKIGGAWKLDDTVYPISLSGLDDVPGLTLLGAPTSGKDKVYVFPGPLVWGSSNEYLTVKESNADDFALSPSDGSFSLSTLETDLSESGQTAVAQAVKTYIDACAASKDLSPDNCPQSEYDYDGVDGTAVWTAPTDLSSLEYRVSTPVTEVYVSGDLSWKVAYVAEDFDGKRSNVTDEVDGSLYGKVDLTKTPPVYSE